MTRALPKLVMSGKHLRERTDQTLRMLEASNVPPTIFAHGSVLARNYLNKLQDLNLDILRDLLTRRANFFAKKRQGRLVTKIINPPEDVMRSILCNGVHLFPRVNGIVSWPIMSPDGHLCVEPGYDPRTKLIYAPSSNFKLPSVTAHPTKSELASAVDLIRELFVDFPFAEEASLANAIAALLTVALRPAIRGRVLMFLLDSPVRGSGKTLLAQTIALCVTGEPVGQTPDCKDDAEWAKRLTTIASEGAPLVFLDDIKHALKSPTLAMFVTAPVWKDRMLGTNLAPS
jgi:hypothetical protein